MSNWDVYIEMIYLLYFVGWLIEKFSFLSQRMNVCNSIYEYIEISSKFFSRVLFTKKQTISECQWGNADTGCLSTTFLVMTTIECSTSNNTEAWGNTSIQREKLMTSMRIINHAMHKSMEKKETKRKKEEIERKTEREKEF